MEGLVVLCGLLGTLLAGWRAYAAARAAVSPLVHEGDRTRSAVDAGRPVFARTRVRRFARHVVISVAWLALSMYGIFLVVAGTEVPK